MRKTRVFIWGSCVSRDTFEHFIPDEFELLTYVARQSALSAYTKPVELIEPGSVDSKFQQRMLSGDFGSSLRHELAAAARDVDLLLVDLVDERLGVYLLPDGTVLTRSVEFIQSGGEVQLPPGTRHLPFGTQQHFEYWSAAIASIGTLIRRAMPRAAVALLDIPWAEQSESGNPTPNSFGMGAHDANPLYRPYVEAAEHALGARVVSVASVRSGDRHPWGAAPFHYAEDVYLRAVESLTGSAGRQVWDLPEVEAPALVRSPAPSESPEPKGHGETSEFGVLYSAHVSDPLARTVVYLENTRELDDTWVFDGPIRALGLNYVRICDPTLTDNPDLKFGWGVGSGAGPGVARILSTVERVAPSGNLIFAGTGPMGYPALRCAMERSAPLVVHNPDLLWYESKSTSALAAIAQADRDDLENEYPAISDVAVPDRPVPLLATVNTAGPVASNRVIPALLSVLNDEKRFAQRISSVQLFNEKALPFALWTPETFSELLTLAVERSNSPEEPA